MAILLRERKAIQLTDDHKPMKYAGFACVFLLLQYRTALTVRAWCWFNRLEEQRRIASFGGSVVNCMGVPRVNGVLAVSRAFGNRLLKDVIRADPDIVERVRDGFCTT